MRLRRRHEKNKKAEMSSVAKPDGKTLGNSLKMNV